MRNAGQGRRTDRLELGWVLAVCALMCGAGVVFILRYGSDVPLADDWGFYIIPLAERTSPQWSWLWEAGGGHRMPLHKLAIWYIWHATQGSLRAAMLCGFIPLAISATLLPLAARAVRGRSEYTDAFFPLLLLHWGHAGVFLWLSTTGVPWVAAIECLLAASFAQPEWYRKWSVAGASAIGVVALSLMGSTGLTAALPFSLGLLLVARKLWQSGCRPEKRNAAMLVAGVVVTGIWFSAVMASFDKREIAQQGAISVSSVAAAAAEFLTMSLGQTARRLWPVSGAVVLGAVVGAIGVLMRSCWRSSAEERLRAVLLILAILAPCATALAVGVGRYLQGGLLNRYGLYSASLLCALYFLAVLYGPSRLRTLAQMVLFAVLCASSLYYASEGLRLGKERLENTHALMSDIAAGTPLTQLVAKHDSVWVGDERRFRRGLLALRSAGIRPFDAIKDDPPMVAWELKPTPSHANAMQASGEGWLGRGRESRVVFSFERPVHVMAIRCAYVLKTRRSSTQWQTSWVRATGCDPFEGIGGQQVLVNFNSAKPRAEEVQYAWIDEPIWAFAISPSAEPCEFRITRLTLFLKPGESLPRLAGSIGKPAEVRPLDSK